MKPPSAEELVGPEPHGLDEECALRNFLGKTHEEAHVVFRNASVTEDFTYMAPAAFSTIFPRLWAT